MSSNQDELVTALVNILHSFGILCAICVMLMPTDSLAKSSPSAVPTPVLCLLLLVAPLRCSSSQVPFYAPSSWSQLLLQKLPGQPLRRLLQQAGHL